MAARAPLWLDYQRPPPGRQLPGIALLVGSLLLSGVLLSMSADLGREIEATDAQVAKLRQSAERRRLFAEAAKPTESATPAPPASASAARWETLFASLEGAADETVTLLGLTPGAREVIITGEARDLPAALDYAQRLQTAPAFSEAYLAKYEVVREHPRQPVRFTVMARLREAPP